MVMVGPITWDFDISGSRLGRGSVAIGAIGNWRRPALGSIGPDGGDSVPGWSGDGICGGREPLRRSIAPLRRAWSLPCVAD